MTNRPTAILLLHPTYPPNRSLDFPPWAHRLRRAPTRRVHQPTPLAHLAEPQGLAPWGHLPVVPAGRSGMCLDPG